MSNYFLSDYKIYLEDVMSLRINHNTSSLNAHRNLSQNNQRAAKSLEKLSSGLAINRAGDAPASLVASEQLRSNIASLEQAVKNAEVSVSMVQTAEGALGEVNTMLVSMRSLAIHAANEGANDAVMLEADQLNIRNQLEAIDRIAQTTQFGSRKLLDGSNGVNGTAIGKGLEFVGATTKTMDSGEGGYDVAILSEASKATLRSTTGLTDEIVKAGEILKINEGGKTATYTTRKTDTVQSAIKNFAALVEKNGMNVTVKGNDEGIITIQHNAYGSKENFQVSSSTAGVLSTEADSLLNVKNGQDLQGTINGEATIGMGDSMTSLVGNPTTEGLTVRFRNAGNEAVAEGTVVGQVTVAQSALTFQVGPLKGNTVNIALPSVSSNQLGRAVDNQSGFNSMKDLDVRTSEGAQDSLALIDKGINEVTQMRSELGSFQKNTLETNIATLRATTENMIAAESVIRDTDMAMEMANYTRNNLMVQSAASMMAQANSAPGRVLNLISD